MVEGCEKEVGVSKDVKFFRGGGMILSCFVLSRKGTTTSTDRVEDGGGRTITKQI